MIKKLVNVSDVRSMNNEEEEIQIVFNTEAAKLLFFKIIILLAVVSLPILLLYWLQETLHPWFGDPSPLSPVYLSLFILLIGWYVFGLGILLPWAGRRINELI
jgi:hypothetical protein